MSETESSSGDIAARTTDEKLKALIRKDIDPEITAVAERVLEMRQEESS